MTTKWVLLIAISALVWGLGPIVPGYAAEQETSVAESPAAKQETSGKSNEISPSKLYEAVSGYLKGLRKKGEQPKAGTKKQPRFQP